MSDQHITELICNPNSDNDFAVSATWIIDNYTSGDWNGTIGNLVNFYSDTSGSQATINLSAIGNIVVSYMSFKDINFIGGTVTASNSSNFGNNSGITFIDDYSVSVDFIGVPRIGVSPLTVDFTANVSLATSAQSSYRVQGYNWCFDYNVSGSNIWTYTTSPQISNIFIGHGGDSFNISLSADIVPSISIVECSMILHTTIDYSSQSATIFSAIASVFANNNGEFIDDYVWKNAIDAVVPGFIEYLNTFTKYKNGIEYSPSVSGEGSGWTFDAGTIGRFDSINSSLILDRHSIQLSFDLLQYRDNYSSGDKTTIYGLCTSYIAAHSTDTIIRWRDLTDYIMANFSTFGDYNDLSLTLKKESNPIDGQYWTGTADRPDLFWSIASNERASFNEYDTTILFGTT